MREASLRYNKVATQMGNQGHCEEGYRRLCEFIWAGVIGNVTETHSWTDRANGGIGPRPPTLPVPQECIGIRGLARRRIGISIPTFIRTNGMAGMILATAPSATWVAMSWKGFSGRSKPSIQPASKWSMSAAAPMNVIRWAAVCDGTFPRAENMPPLQGVLVRGIERHGYGTAFGGLHAARGTDAQSPAARRLKLKEKYPDEDIDQGRQRNACTSATKGIIFTATYGGTIASNAYLPMEKMDEIKQPPISCRDRIRQSVH